MLRCQKFEVKPYVFTLGALPMKASDPFKLQVNGL